MAQNSANENTCSVHPGQIRNLYCHDCRFAICFKCSRERCLRHNVDNASDLMGKLQDFKTNQLPKLDLKIQDLKQIVVTRKKKKDEIKESICRKARSLKEEMIKKIDCVVDKNLEDMERAYEEQSSPTKDLQTEIQNFKDTTEDQVNQWETTLTSDPNPDQLLPCLQSLHPLIEETHKKIEKVDTHISSSSSTSKMEEINVQEHIFSELRSWIFPSTCTETSNLSDTVLNVSGETSTDSSTNTEIENSSDAVLDVSELVSTDPSVSTEISNPSHAGLNVLEKASIVKRICPNTTIHQMCPSIEGKAWVFRGKQIQLISPNGECLNTHTMDHLIGRTCIASNKDGVLLVTIPEKRTILKITATGSAEMSIENKKNLIPCGIGIRQKTNEILLSFVDKLDFNPDIKSQRMIRVYDLNGRLKEEDLGCCGERKLFVQPQRIAVSQSTDHVAIINRTKQLNGEIILLKAGEFNSVFPEPDKTRKSFFRKSFREKFDPRDVEFDVDNNIVTCDYESKSIYIIQADFRNIIQQYNCRTWPLCLTCMPNHNLWVGFALEGINILKYLD